MATCGAKTRSGKPCQSKAMANGRCRMHGGRSSGPRCQDGNTNAAKPGSLYSKFLSEEEQGLSLEAERGRIDAELDLARVMLRRAIEAQMAAGDNPELDEIIERDGDRDSEGKQLPGRTERKYKRRDYAAIVDRCLARVSSLERDREDLEGKRLANSKARMDLDDPDDAVPTPVKIVVEVKDARRPEDAKP